MTLSRRNYSNADAFRSWSPIDQGNAYLASPVVFLYLKVSAGVTEKLLWSSGDDKPHDESMAKHKRKHHCQTNYSLSPGAWQQECHRESNV